MLRTLWVEGLSSNQIGLRMGRTKNSVIGRSHRLDLPARVSPITRDGRQHKDGRPSVARAPRATLPLLASQRAEPTLVQFALPLAMPRPVAAAPRLPAAVVALPVVKAPKPYARVGECQWTDSDCAPWLWCSEPTINGGSWCAAHHKRCFIGRRSFMEAAD